jgi:hypothetical protein
VIYGVDVSAYQPNFDFAACRREGYDFAIIKATEGTGWKSAYYRAQVERARAAGLLVAAYHYVRGSDVAGQVNNIKSMVSTDMPVILDVEDGAPPIGVIRQLNAAVNAAGYRTPLIYIPRWYWSGVMGSPSLAGLPPNWHSRYPDNAVRRKESFTLGAEYWPTFGGLPTVIAQFTSSLAVANYPTGRIDGNAYRGTREQLAALLGGQEENDVGHVDSISDEAALKIAKTLLNFPAELPGGRRVGDPAPGPDGKLRLRLEENFGHTNRVANATRDEVIALRVAFDKLAEAYAADRDVEAEDIKRAVTDALRESVVNVDINVKGADTKPAA